MIVDRFAVASGNWNQTSVWSDSSGGSGGSSVPGAGDSATFDAASGSITVTLTTDQQIATVDATGYTGTLALGLFALIVTAALTLVSGMTLSGSSGTIRLTGTGTQAVDLGDQTPGVLEITNTGGAITLSNAPATIFRAHSDTADINVIVTAGDAFTWTNIDINGDAGNDVVFRSTVAFTQYDVTITNASSVMHLDTQDWNNGGATINATEGTNTNSGRNAGFNFEDASSTSESSTSNTFSSTSSSSESSTSNTESSTSSSSDSSSSSSTSSLTTQSSTSQTPSSSSSSRSSTTTSSSSPDLTTSSTSSSSESSSLSSLTSRTPSSESTSSSSSQTTLTTSTSTTSNTPSSTSTTSSSSTSTSRTPSSSSSTSTTSTSSQSTTLTSSSSTSSDSTLSTLTTSTSSDSSITTSSSSTSSPSFSESSTSSTSSETTLTTLSTSTSSLSTSVTTSSSTSTTSTSSTSQSSLSSRSSISESGFTSSSLSSIGDDEISPWTQLERQILQILSDDPTLQRFHGDWKDCHVILGIEDNRPPPLNGLSTPYIEFELEAITDELIDSDDDKLACIIRVQMTHRLQDHSRSAIRNNIQKVIRPLRQQLALNGAHPEDWTFLLGDIIEIGWYRQISLDCTFNIFVTADTIEQANC